MAMAKRTKKGIEHGRHESKASQATTTSTISQTPSIVTIAAPRHGQYQRDLTAACARGDEELVRRLLRRDEHLSSPGKARNDNKDTATALRKALQKASARHHIGIVRLLLQHGADVDARAPDEFPPLYRAAQAGQFAVVAELLLHRPDIEARELRTGQTPLFAASVRGFHAIVALLLAKKAYVDAPDRDGRSPLLAIASNPAFTSVQTASLLAVHGANLEARDSIGRTPLLWASTNRNYELAKTLLQKGASVHAVNNRGRTGLHLTIDGNKNTNNKRPREEMFQLLLKYNADSNAASDGGWRPLHNAAQKGLTSLVKILLDTGADINASLTNGMTALHWAAFNGFDDVAQLIWSYPQADLGITDSFGRAAWLCAAERGHDDLVELLSPGHNSHRLPDSMRDATQAFNATVVEFKDYGEKQRISKPPVFDLLYKWDDKNGRPAIPLWTDGPPGAPKNTFKWIHLPANNLAWVETLMINWFIESGCRDLEGFKALMKTLEQEHRGPFPHANYMRPFCQRISSQQEPERDEDSELLGGDMAGTPGHGHGHGHGHGAISPIPIKLKGIKRSASNLSQMTLNNQGIPGGDGKIVMFMPYLHYETDESRQRMMEAIRTVTSSSTLSMGSEEEKTADQKLVEGYLNHRPSPLHPRRTLDQFFYRGIDTSTRDRDQVVYRYCEANGHERKVFMVDQLWVFVLNKDLIVTCFPERWELQKSNINAKDPLGVLDGIMGEMNAKTRPPVRSVYHMAIIASNQCSGMFSRHRADNQDYQFLDFFESSVGRVTEDLTNLFHHFEKASSQSQEWSKPSRRSKLRNMRKKLKNRKSKAGDETENEDSDAAHADESTSFDRLLDIGAETSLLTEVRDIRDELNILSLILNSQLWTIGDLKNSLIEELSTSSLMGSARLMRSVHHANNNVHVADVRKRTLEQHRQLSQHKRDIQTMDEQAERLYQSLTDLLDLKQKHSNALEARFASEQAMSAQAESTTVFVFTIVTILFLPMSFIAAYLAIDSDKYEDKDFIPTWTFGGGMGISLVLVLIAFTVADITKAFRRMKLGIKNRLFDRPDKKKAKRDAERAAKSKATGVEDGKDLQNGFRKRKVVRMATIDERSPSPTAQLAQDFRRAASTPPGSLSKMQTNMTTRSDVTARGLSIQRSSFELDLVKVRTEASMTSTTQRYAVSAKSLPRSRQRGCFGEEDLEWGRRQEFDRELTADTF